MAFCTQCGTKMEKGLRFCTKCGTKIDMETFVPKQNSRKQQLYQQQEITIHHTTKSEKNASTGFGRAFGETTGTAAGCFVVIIAILAVIVLFVVFSFL